MLQKLAEEGLKLTTFRHRWEGDDSRRIRVIRLDHLKLTLAVRVDVEMDKLVIANSGL